MSTLTRNCIISSMIVGLWIACSPSPSLSPQARSNAVSDDDEQAYDDDLDATSEVLAEYDFDAEIDDFVDLYTNTRYVFSPNFALNALQGTN